MPRLCQPCCSWSTRQPWGRGRHGRGTFALVVAAVAGDRAILIVFYQRANILSDSEASRAFAVAGPGYAGVTALVASGRLQVRFPPGVGCERQAERPLEGGQQAIGGVVEGERGVDGGPRGDRVLREATGKDDRAVLEDRAGRAPLGGAGKFGKTAGRFGVVNHDVEGVAALETEERAAA